MINRNKEHRPLSLPRTVAIELTYQCNHACVFCSCPWYFSGNKYPLKPELSTQQWFTAIDILYQIGIDTFSISGGEALLKEGLLDILAHIREQGRRRGLHNEIVLISNGRAMTHGFLQAFKELDIHLSMSLPGYESFKYHTGVDNADGVLYWFKQAQRMGLSTTLNVTATKRNLYELFRTIALGIINGAGDVLLNRFLPGGRGLEHQKELLLSVEEMNEAIGIAEEVLSHSDKYGSVGTEIAYCSIKEPERFKHLNIGYRCAAARGFFVVDPAGQIRVCNHSPKVVGNIFAQPIITDVVYWNLFAKSSLSPVMCKSCSKQSFCDCGCREVASILNGSPSAPDITLFPTNS